MEDETRTDGVEDTLDISHLSEETRAAIMKRQHETRGMSADERLADLLALEDDW